MKFNKILSSALVLVMLLSSIMAVIPVSASAADNKQVVVNMGEVDPAKNSSDYLAKFVKEEYLNYRYSTAEEMLKAELEKGNLDSVSAGGYILYINRYTGFVFYQNTKTGQILTSNPTDPGTSGSSLDYSVLSQIDIDYKDVSDSSSIVPLTYKSLEQLENGFALSLSPIATQPDGRAGISVKYTLGENAANYRVPKYITEADFRDHIVNPMFKKIAAAVEQYCGDVSFDSDLSDNDDIFYQGYYDGGVINRKLNVISANAAVYASAAGKIIIDKYVKAINDVFSAYGYTSSAAALKSGNQTLLTEVPVLRDGVNVYSIKNNNTTTYKLANNALVDILGDDYTKDDAAEDFAATGCLKNEDINVASFVVSINYTLSPDGELYYEIPMSAPYFVNNNPNFSIVSLKPLRYFGAGIKTNEGYIFFPDGSGTVVNFDKINTIQADYSSAVYGNDYGYSSLDPTRAHFEQVTMPVFGIVNEVKANAATTALENVETITNGFFAIVEEGSSLMNLSFNGSSHKYISAAAVYKPHPMDIRDLSETLSAGASGKYFIVSEAKYEGNYKTKIVMLRDEKLAGFEPAAYEPTYVGMANCYRDYLLNKGIIGQNDNNTKNDIPLYIEVLGAMDVTQKILSFPVVMSTPLTTFDNVATMYSGFAESGVKNVNFRLTGFANGGMAATYPVKASWQNSLGGKKGLENLVDKAEEINAKNDGSNLGLYPDFDFLYIHNTALFDGVSYRGTVAVMVDNRYASKQSFNAVLQLYESIFAMVVSPDSYDGLYDKFNKDYSKYGLTGLSVATLGSELNSNFDIDNSINRESALAYTKSLLGRISEEYSVMTDIGNVYAMRYADHVLNAPVDSSHYKYSSYTVPFYGMVFHSYVNYAGSPINYSGSPDYNILRAIENGANLQYILCYENTNYLKADATLSKYYGVDYKNWKDIIVKQYNQLNAAIGDVQDNIITDHRPLIAERVVDRYEMYSNYSVLINEFVEHAETQFEAEISAIASDLRANGGFEGKTGLWVNIDINSVEAGILKALNITTAQAKSYNLNTSELKLFGIDGESQSLYNVILRVARLFVEKFEAAYPEDANSYKINLSAETVEYKSKFKFETTSYAVDKNYETTSYTCSNNNVVMVTYTDADTGAATIFFINFNTYDVKLKLDAEFYPGIEKLVDDKGYFTVEATDYVKIK